MLKILLASMVPGFRALVSLLLLLLHDGVLLEAEAGSHTFAPHNPLTPSRSLFPNLELTHNIYIYIYMYCKLHLRRLLFIPLDVRHREERMRRLCLVVAAHVTLQEAVIGELGCRWSHEVRLAHASRANHARLAEEASTECPTAF